MGILGDVVSNGIDAFNDSASGTTLQQFLDKFSSPKGRYVDTIDPLGTFDVKFKFYPTLTPDELDQLNEVTTQPDKWGRVGQSLTNSAVNAGKNFRDNTFGGLYSSRAEGGKGSVMKAHKDYDMKGKHSFLEYLAPANLLQGGEQWQDPDQANCPLELNLGLYIQSITGLNMQMYGEEKINTPLGDFPVQGSYIQCNGELQMEIINTKAALHERIFYPWLREVTLPWWSYESQPYTTATVTVDFTKHNDVKYVFTGVRPKQIKLLDAKQEADSGNITREVVFMYDFMFIISDLNVNDSWGDKLLGTAGALAGGASKMLNI